MDVYMWMYVYNYITHTCLERRVSCHERKCSVSADVDFPMFRLHAQIQPPYGLCEVKPLLGIFRNEIAETCRLQSWNKSWTSTRLSSRLWKHVLYIKINQNLYCLLWSSIYIYIHTYVCVFLQMALPASPFNRPGPPPMLEVRQSQWSYGSLKYFRFSQ